MVIDPIEYDIPGLLNFRAVAPYPARNGRLRADTLFRSGAFDDVDESGQQQLAALGIRRVFDFRSEHEKSVAPSPLLSTDKFEVLAHKHNIRSGDLVAIVTDPAATRQDCLAAMTELYARMPREFREVAATYFRAVSGPGGIVVHCSAGKDRTGVFVALLLDLLGVSRADIMADYLLSNTAVPDLMARLDRRKKAMAVDTLSDEVVNVLSYAHAPYLDAMFARMQHDFGSTRSYVTDFLGLSQEEVDHIEKAFIP